MNGSVKDVNYNELRDLANVLLIQVSELSQVLTGSSSISANASGGLKLRVENIKQSYKSPRAANIYANFDNTFNGIGNLLMGAYELRDRIAMAASDYEKVATDPNGLQ